MKKKYKRAGTTSERQDYRKGGYVGDGKRVKKYLAGEIKYPSNFNFDFSGVNFSPIPNISIPTNTPTCT